MHPRNDLANWMAKHADKTPLQALSIPGTHNSSTYFRALPSVRCQAVSLREQLEHGIRWLDFRLQVDHPKRQDCDDLSVVHGVFPVALSGSKKFRDSYNDILDFLARNPSETIILSLKREGTGKGTDADLAKRLHDHYMDDTHWVTKSGVPTLGEARGKIVLLRRFQLGNDTASLSKNIHGINAQPWADNCPNSTAGDVQVQDFYEVLHTKNIERKIGYIHDHCGRVAATSVDSLSHGPLSINFLSASNFWRPGCWPDKIAAKINPAVTRYLCEQHGLVGGGTERHGGTGVLVCDWVGEDGDWDLVETIVGMNEKLLVQQC